MTVTVTDSVQSMGPVIVLVDVVVKTPTFDHEIVVLTAGVGASAANSLFSSSSVQSPFRNSARRSLMRFTSWRVS